tara:strand:- start:1968 stop:2519 length:552 start_codon:yes stop_codon:yes gene_type:complete
MRAHQLTRLALLGEGALVVIALAWAVFRGLPLAAGNIVPAVFLGFLTAVLLMLVNWYLLRVAPDVAGVREFRNIYQTLLKPTFRTVKGFDIVVISVAAGIGEELFFRGVIQPEIGVLFAALFFGLLHTGGRGTWIYGMWVAIMGAVLGAVTIVSGGLLAAILAHTTYDAAALFYIRSDDGEHV